MKLLPFFEIDLNDILEGEKARLNYVIERNPKHFIQKLVDREERLEWGQKNLPAH